MKQQPLNNMGFVVNIVTLLTVALLMHHFTDVSGALQSTLQWSAHVSTDYPPSNPLRVSLGTTLLILCPVDGTSNVWIQRHREQYDNCDCNAAATENDDLRSTCFTCDSSSTIFHVCQDEVTLSIKTPSQHLCSALGFDSDTVYYLISYSRGERPLAGYNRTLTSGGQCLEGFRMALHVLPTDSETTSANPLQTTTTFTDSVLETNESVLETNDSAYKTSFQPTTSEIPLTTRVTDDGSGTTSIQEKSETLLLIIMLCLIISYPFYIS